LRVFQNAFDVRFGGVPGGILFFTVFIVRSVLCLMLKRDALALLLFSYQPAHEGTYHWRMRPATPGFRLNGMPVDAGFGQHPGEPSSRRRTRTGDPYGNFRWHREDLAIRLEYRGHRTDWFFTPETDFSHVRHPVVRCGGSNAKRQADHEMLAHARNVLSPARETSWKA
jgi:hypothetical protein